MRKPCCENRETNKGAWSKQEDQKLIDYVQKHGEGCWHTLPKAAGLLRCGKSCRLRWVNYLKPDLKRGNFQEDEIELIIKLHGLLGNRWSLIAGRLPGRTDNEVKNYWNTHLRKKLSLMGTVPKHHHHHHHLHLSGGVAQCHNNTNNNIDSNNRSNNSNINQCENTASPERSPTPISTGTGTGIPDLNLDLTLSTPPPAAEEHRTHHACNRDIDTGTPATMLLLG